MPPFLNLLSAGFGTELIYSFVIIVCSLMIYFGTKDLYELSLYKGIKYFRNAFLFFAIAFFFRSFIKSLFVFGIDILKFSPRFLGVAMLVIFMYASTIAIFYLLYSVMWKKWNGKNIYLFHFLAAIISIISVASRKISLLLGLHAVLFAIILFTVYTAYKSSKHKKRSYNLYLIYILLFAFWILNVIEVHVPKFLQLFKLIIYIISAGLFLLILYRVLKKTGSG